jgi:drug/metabolite transporter (DMT)-like permease
MPAGSVTAAAPDAPAADHSKATNMPTPRRGWFFDPYVQILVGALLVTASELLLKKGASVAPGASWTGIDALASAWTWGGIVTYVLSFASWLYVLRFVPLGIAFALINGVHVLVPVGSWAFLGETLSAQRWAGIGRVVCGILFIARDAARAEEEL